MKPIEELLAASAAGHRHLCPRQVLGVRMGLLAGSLLSLDLPETDKRLLTIVETDGCAVDGISAATQCRVGRRTLRVVDYGKVAATFVDTATDAAVRIAPRAQARALAAEWAPEARSRWEAQLLGYQRMPDEVLFAWQPVQLVPPVGVWMSRPGLRVTCENCGEEIMNAREVEIGGSVMCRACAGLAYYQTPGHPLPAGCVPAGALESQV